MLVGIGLASLLAIVAILIAVVTLATSGDESQTPAAAPAARDTPAATAPAAETRPRRRSPRPRASPSSRSSASTRRSPRR